MNYWTNIDESDGDDTLNYSRSLYHILGDLRVPGILDSNISESLSNINLSQGSRVLLYMIMIHYEELTRWDFKPGDLTRFIVNVYNADNKVLKNSKYLSIPEHIDKLITDLKYVNRKRLISIDLDWDNVPRVTYDKIFSNSFIGKGYH